MCRDFAQASPYRGQRIGIARKPQRHAFIGFERIRNHLRQSRRVQQTRRHARSESGTECGQHRQSGPQRVARRGVRAIGLRIEEKIGQAMPGKMFGRAQPRREHQPVGRDAARFGLTLKIVHGIGIVFEQPEHASRNFAQQPHPEGENLRRDFVIVVEAAEDEARFGQARLAAREPVVGDCAPRIVALIAVRQIGDLFGVVGRCSSGITIASAMM